jgi:hypothetical protein
MIRPGLLPVSAITPIVIGSAAHAAARAAIGRSQRDATVYSATTTPPGN